MEKIRKETAKNIWIHSQRLDQRDFFGAGSSAVVAAIDHLGYVQIDTISVIERCHHHILYSRIPSYRREQLQKAQSQDKSVFEYWTHALAYVPTSHYKYYVPQMKNVSTASGTWFSTVTNSDYKKVKNLLVRNGPISIRDIKDDVPIEKTHSWGSTKPSKKALQLGFYTGEFVVGERDGMLKKYDLAKRHFGWDKLPKAATGSEYIDYILNRALKSQGLVSLDSICHLDAKQKLPVRKLIEKKVRSGELLEVEVNGAEKILHWATPEVIGKKYRKSSLTHILSPFDPLIIQRKRLQLLFDYNHIFEAYVPKVKRKFGYFSLPVLIGNEIVALLDLKTDRINQKLLINNWIWIAKQNMKEKSLLIERQLDRFEKFQLAP